MNLTPLQAQWLTLAFVVVVTIAVIGYDILAIRTWGVEASISKVMRRLFSAYPSLWAAFLIWVGIMIGHFGFPVE